MILFLSINAYEIQWQKDNNLILNVDCVKSMVNEIESNRIVGSPKNRQ